MKPEVPQFLTLRIWRNRAFLRTNKSFKSHFAKCASSLFLVATTFFPFEAKKNKHRNSWTNPLKKTHIFPKSASHFSLKRHHLVQQNTLSTLRRKDARSYQSRECGSWDCCCIFVLESRKCEGYGASTFGWFWGVDCYLFFVVFVEAAGD